MSVVANIVCTEASWIACDGRRRDAGTGQIVDENTLKMQILNNHVCVGYTGTYDLAVAILDALKAPQNAAILPIAKSDEIAYAIREIIQNATISAEYSASFLVTGLSAAGKMASYAFGTSGVFKELVPSALPNYRYASIGAAPSGHALEDYLDRKLLALCGREPPTTYILQALRRYIADVADSDDTVNKNVRFLQIRNGKPQWIQP